MLVLSALVVCVGGCGDSHEAVTRETLHAQQELKTVLDEVTDEASVKAALPRVKELSARLQSLKLRYDKLGEPPAEVQYSLKAKFDQDIRKNTDAIRQNLARLDPLHALQLQDALNMVSSEEGK
jgi:hypothetical protein